MFKFSHRTNNLKLSFWEVSTASVEIADHYFHLKTKAATLLQLQLLRVHCALNFQSSPSTFSPPRVPLARTRGIMRAERWRSLATGSGIAERGMSSGRAKCNACETGPTATAAFRFALATSGRVSATKNNGRRWGIKGTFGKHSWNNRVNAYRSSRVRPVYFVSRGSSSPRATTRIRGKKWGRWKWETVWLKRSGTVIVWTSASRVFDYLSGGFFNDWLSEQWFFERFTDLLDICLSKVGFLNLRLSKSCFDFFLLSD